MISLQYIDLGKGYGVMCYIFYEQVISLEVFTTVNGSFITLFNMLLSLILTDKKSRYCGFFYV